jgi:hypothetical protein
MAGNVSYTSQLYQAVQNREIEFRNILNSDVPKMQEVEYGVNRVPYFTNDLVSRFGSSRELIMVFQPTYGMSPERCWAAYTQKFIPLVQRSIDCEHIDALAAIDAAWVPCNFYVRVNDVKRDVDSLPVNSAIVRQFQLRCRLRETFFAYLRMYHIYLRVSSIVANIPVNLDFEVPRRNALSLRGASLGKRPRNDADTDDEVEEDDDSKRQRHASGFWSVFSSLFDRFR